MARDNFIDVLYIHANTACMCFSGINKLGWEAPLIMCSFSRRFYPKQRSGSIHICDILIRSQILNVMLYVCVCLSRRNMYSQSEEEDDDELETAVRAWPSQSSIVSADDG